MNDQSQKFSPPALPSTVADLIARKKTMHVENLNDVVDQIHLKLWSDPIYQRYLSAVWDEDCVEGSCNFDDGKACEMIREFAIKHAGPDNSFHLIKSGGSDGHPKSLRVLQKTLGVVLRRYGISRTERRRSVSGEPVSGVIGKGDE